MRSPHPSAKRVSKSSLATASLPFSIPALRNPDTPRPPLHNSPGHSLYAWAMSLTRPFALTVAPSRPNALRRRTLALIPLLLASLLLPACINLPRQPVPKERIEEVEILGIPYVRSWGDEASPAMTKVIGASIELQRRCLAAKRVITLGDIHMLAMSGGESDGVFGAGYLNGWTADGTRPKFGTVTGISTGAFIAPFAFLGSDYDAFLSYVYTSVSTKDIFAQRGLLSGLFSDVMAKIDPLCQLLGKCIDRPFLGRAVADCAIDRIRIIGVTNMHTQRPVNWSMAKIACSNHLETLDLFREVLMAAPFIPAIFSLVIFDVELDGKKYDKLHVDGGVTSQGFICRLAFSFKSLPDQAVVRMVMSFARLIATFDQSAGHWRYVPHEPRLPARQPQLQALSCTLHFHA